jgi:uncharacterized protein YeeX (DUF496 family)
MTDLEAILQAIDTLPEDAVAQVQKHVIERQQQLKAVEDKIHALDELTASFWEGFSEAEIEQIISDMNSEYIEVDEE